nr:hypothetical protein [uncultured Anaeromusa sp.]
MEGINKLKKMQINEVLPMSYSFICFASFEKRSVSIPLTLDTSRIAETIILRNIGGNSGVDNQENVNTICEHMPNCKVKEVNITEPLSIADGMAEIVKTLIDRCTEAIVVDISTFTHEALLILLRFLYDNKDEFKSILCLYNGALMYSGGDSPDKIWLSKGCCDVRNVIGYPGRLKPSAKNHLIVLAGYETERATRLIEIIEPDLLSLGDCNEPTDASHEDAMRYFKGRFDEWKNSFQGLISESFTFSCQNVEKTVKVLCDVIAEKPNENNIIVPLNTKISTVATAIVALRNPKIQVCYAVPEMYNTQKYSEPSDNITIIDLSKIRECAK